MIKGGVKSPFLQLSRLLRLLYYYYEAATDVHAHISHTIGRERGDRNGWRKREREEVRFAQVEEVTGGIGAGPARPPKAWKKKMPKPTPVLPESLAACLFGCGRLALAPVEGDDFSSVKCTHVPFGASCS